MTPHYGADYLVAYQRDLCGVALTDGGKLAQLRIRVVTLGDLKQPCATPFYEHPPSSTPVLDFAACFWESQINRYDYLRGPKEIDESPFYCRCDRPCAATTEARWAWKEDGPPQRHPRPKGRYDTRSLFSKLHSPEKT